MLSAHLSKVQICQKVFISVERAMKVYPCCTQVLFRNVKESTMYE